MFHAFLATIVIGCILVLSEVLWRKSILKGEPARKFVHIVAGSFIAFLPFWMSYGWITFLAVGFIVANLLNRYTPLFHAIHAITRRSWGDLLLGLGVLIAALLQPNRWLFAGAILQVALADGLAAIIGLEYGKRRYKLFDHIKTPIGTITFLVASFAVTVLIVLATKNQMDINPVLILSVVPLAMTLLENISGYGSDNITLPLGYLWLLWALGLS